MTLPQIDWHSAENQVAVNPLQPDSAEGLADFLASLGLSHLCLFQTSGSEGLPKWVALPKEAFFISGRAVNEHFEVTAEDHWLIALPLHHVGGSSILARAHLSGSRYTQAQGRWQPVEFTAMCRENGITLASLVPTQVHDLVQARLTCPDSLRAVIVGGGGMSQALADAAVELGWRVFQSYGMTEAASQIATQPYNPFGAVFDVKSLQVLPHWRVHTDAEGVLTVSGPALARGYVTRATSGSWTWQTMPAEGLKTRDRVRLWSHGTRPFLQFVGRESGYLKIMGELVHLAPLQEQVENLAHQLCWSRLPFLVPVPDPRAETRLLLAWETGSGDPVPLLSQFHQVSPPWLRISEAVQLDRIPRSDLGKVQMEELRQLIRRSA